MLLKRLFPRTFSSAVQICWKGNLWNPIEQIKIIIGESLICLGFKYLFSFSVGNPLNLHASWKDWIISACFWQAKANMFCFWRCKDRSSEFIWSSRIIITLSILNRNTIESVAYSDEERNWNDNPDRLLEQ
jgi:hypothetical protein